MDNTKVSGNPDEQKSRIRKREKVEGGQECVNFFELRMLPLEKNKNMWLFRELQR